MRLWSISPHYLDRQGLLAVWREGLLAQKVLQGETKGYKNHPQLERFRNVYNPAKGLNPLYYLGLYLLDIIKEADGRGYSFDIEKIKHIPTKPREYQLTVTTGQLDYEFKLLQNKLLFGRENLSALPKYIENHRLFLEHNKNWMDNIGEIIIPHPLFKVIEGDIEKWERIKR